MSFLIIVLIIFFVKINLLNSQMMSAQQYLNELEIKNQFMDGFYEGKMEVLMPYQKKNEYNFYYIQKKQNLYWELQKENRIQFKIICNKDYSEIFFYDKRRDELKEIRGHDILKNWNHLPYFIYCGIFLEKIIEPQRIETIKNEVLIAGKFFFPFIKKTIRIHFSKDYRLVKYLTYNDNNILQYRILFYYDLPLLEQEQKNIKKINVNFPVKWEIINAIHNSVVIIQWNLYQRNYKIDDLRFKKEFISR